METLGAVLPGVTVTGMLGGRVPVAVAGLEPDGDGSGRRVRPGGLRDGGIVELAVAVEVPRIA